jgi:bis(5'-nucleosyl)-tetraphosphatase (symmetrical)
LARYAIGDIQGCYAELRALLARLKFSADRDQLWLVGDLVNRGPQSLEVLRFVRSLGDNAVVVLGNHDLHLLAVAAGQRKRRSGDTLNTILEAPDRQGLVEWLQTRPLAHFDGERRDLLVHAGVIPQWTAAQTVGLADEVSSALAHEPARFFDRMYGDRPDRWSETLHGMERLRFAVNVLTRMRVCTADGRVDLKMKGPPDEARLPFRPWFEYTERATREVRVIFGHWSALGFVHKSGVIALDTGCVWDGSLTAINLDETDARPLSEPCRKVSAAPSEP